MSNKGPKRIYSKTKDRGMSFKHVCEVGVYLPETSNVIDFIRDGIRTTLVEADPVTVEKIKEYFKDYSITLFPVAVWDTSGVLQLSKAAASTFATELKQSPAIVNDHYTVSKENTFEVPCRVFSEMDDGTIDLLSIDIEGGEWYVIKHLVSKPKVISIETHGKYYTNPFISEISNWMSRMGYRIWYKDASDTIYVNADNFSPTLTDRLETKLTELRISWKKFKRIFKPGQ
jgi:FkbM family methyltransferase